MDDVGARAAAEPAAGLVVPDEDTRVTPALSVLDPNGVALFEPVDGRVALLVRLAHSLRLTGEPRRTRSGRAAVPVEWVLLLVGAEDHDAEVVSEAVLVDPRAP
jgi:hypothetical protein